MLKYISTDGGAKEEGYTFEDNDCAVRALALACGISYTHAHMWMYLKAGRKATKPIELQTCLQLHEVMVGNKQLIVHPLTAPLEVHCVTHCVLDDDEVTVKQFIQSHLQGAYMLIIPGHIFAVVDGVIEDNFAPGVTGEHIDICNTLEPLWYAIEVRE